MGRKGTEVDELTFVLDVLCFFMTSLDNLTHFGVDYGFRTQIWGRLRQDSNKNKG